MCRESYLCEVEMGIRMGMERERERVDLIFYLVWDLGFEASLSWAWVWILDLV